MVAARLSKCLAPDHTTMAFGLAGLLPRLGGLFDWSVDYGNANLENMPVLAVLQSGNLGVPRALALDVHQCNIAVLS